MGASERERTSKTPTSGLSKPTRVSLSARLVIATWNSNFIKGITGRRWAFVCALSRARAHARACSWSYTQWNIRAGGHTNYVRRADFGLRLRDLGEKAHDLAPFSHVSRRSRQPTPHIQVGSYLQ